MATSSRKMMKIPLPIATLSRFRRIHAIWPSERPSIASPLTPSMIASGAADSGVISSGAAMMDSISWMFADKPCPCDGQGSLPYLYREDVPRGTRRARGQRGSFCDCELIGILPSQPGPTGRVSCHNALQQVNAHLFQRPYGDQAGIWRHRHAGHRDDRAARRTGRLDP